MFQGNRPELELSELELSLVADDAEADDRLADRRPLWFSGSSTAEKGRKPALFQSVLHLGVKASPKSGRLKVAPPGAALDELAKPIEVAELLKGDNSEEAFSQLIREHAKSGVSGVLPEISGRRGKEKGGDVEK